MFVTDDGRIIYADGQEIDPTQADQIVWRERAATYEELATLQIRAHAAQETVEEITGYQGELNAARERHQSPGNPYGSIDDMDAGQERLEKTAPDAVTRAGKAEMSAEAATPTVVTGDKPIL